MILCSLLFIPFTLKAQVSYTTDTTCYVTVTYNGNSAAVVISSDIRNYVTASVSGGHVSITSTATSALNEITYGLKGSTTNGSFTLVGTYKASIDLFGVSITNPSGPAIDIQNGKRIELSVKKETVSTLKDGTSTAQDAWKGALQCKGHFQFKGKGTLNVYGNYAHGIWSKEYMEVKNCSINVCSAVKDAINCNRYFLMESGVINLGGFGDDGIQVSLKSEDTSTENTGNFTMDGGVININMTDAAGEPVKAEGATIVAPSALLNVSTALDNVEGDDMKTRKVIRNGQILIERGDKTYNLLGSEVEE